jgi:predicted protein tyrosine phosphatase/CheY-like chemotaxis protein
MKFPIRTHNRLTLPTKHLLIVEDLISNQMNILSHFNEIFEADGLVQISVVPGAESAAALIELCKIDLIILDHDLPEGNGSDLLNWMKSKNIQIPIITFSGIPYNNSHMINLGANYLFNKNEVINGDADHLIKKILKLNFGVAESYVNKVCINAPTAERWWATHNILVGGSIVDSNDWQHLKKTYGIDAVINVETEHDDFSYGIDKLLEIRVNDDGGDFPNTYVHQAIAFVNAVGLDKTFYIHCQMGGSRSPAFVYGVLRGCYNFTKEQALDQINKGKPSFQTNKWGWHHYHQNYIKSIEEGLATNNIAEYYHNTYSNSLFMTRFYITKNLLIGGNVCDKKDWKHLVEKYRVEACINADGHTDNNKDIDNLLECHVHDNGDPFPKEKIKKVIDFALKFKDKPIYVHCHAGISRSPHFAYIILRGVYGLSPQQALDTVKNALPSTHNWGFSQHHASYIKSIEEALND